MLPPGPTDPPERQSFRWFAAPYDFLSECLDRFGDPFTLRLLDYGAHVCVTDPEAIRTVFTAPPGTLEAGAGNDPLRPLLGDRSLLLLDGHEHRRHRKILMPAFAEERIDRFRSTIETITERALLEWSEGTTLAIHPTAVKISLEVILEFVLGGSRRLVELAALFTEMLQRPSLSLKLFEGGDPICAQIDELLFEEIRTREPGGVDAVLDLLIAHQDDEGRLDEVAVRDELVTLIVAGHETTASSLAWAMFSILYTPGEVERVRERGAPYWEAAAKETLRMRPVIPVVSRRVAAPFEVAGHRLEVGQHVMPCIYLTHHRDDLYPDPERFDPSRFLGTRPSPYAYLPFGGGARRCIGMGFALSELSTAIGRIVCGFDLEGLDRAPPRPVRSALMIVPSGGTRVRVRRLRRRVESDS